MSEWYFSQDGQRVGPMDEAAARSHARSNPNAWAWCSDMAQWQPVNSLPVLTRPTVEPPPLPGAGPWGQCAPRRANELDYRIIGQEMQFIEVQMDPGESVIAEAGAMMYKNPTVEMEAEFGDSSASGGVFDKLWSAGKRVLAGENMFSTVFTHKGQGKAHIAFSAPFPGTILPIDLAQMGGQLICQKDSFLAAAKGVSVSIWLQRNLLTGLFGGGGFIMQKLEGDGLAFIHLGGTCQCRDLAAGEVLHVDAGSVAALSSSISMDVVRAGGVKTMLFGGEGLFFATLTGPGRVWLQSLPFSRLAGRMLAAAPKSGGSSGSSSFNMFSSSDSSSSGSDE